MAMLLLAGCGDSGFDPPSIVMGPRILAVSAEPPEAPPGVDVTLRPTLAGADGHTLEMSVDLSIAALAMAAGQTLGEREDAVPLREEAGVHRLDGADTQRAVDALFARVGDAPLGTPEAVVRQVYEDVGLTIPITVTLRDASGAVELEAFKRITLTERPSPTTNPPPPAFSIGGARVVGDADGVCVPVDAAPVVAAGAEVVLAPDPDEAWLESYPVLDLEGQVVTGMENAYYSWFSTGGAFDFAVTRAPGRDVTWTAPEDAGVVPLWLIVRDGHLGASACRVDVAVE